MLEILFANISSVIIPSLCLIYIVVLSIFYVRSIKNDVLRLTGKGISTSRQKPKFYPFNGLKFENDESITLKEAVRYVPPVLGI